MANTPQTGIRKFVEEKAWVIAVDVTGFLLLLSLLLSAGCAPALKEWMFVLLTIVPVMAVITMLIPHRKPQPVATIVPARPASQRKIFIAPRPCDQRLLQAA